MFNEFCVTGIKDSLADKTITVQTNFKINPKTVNLKTVVLKTAQSGGIVNYTVTTDNSSIVIEFNDWPMTNTDYYLIVSKDIEDALGRKVKNPFEKTINFSSQIKHKIAILKPRANEAIRDSIIEVNVKATPEDDLEKGYYYEIASDVAFCDVIKQLLTQEEQVIFNELEDGQYFLRCRAQDLNNNDYGPWSDTIEFVILNDTNCKCEETENDDINQEDNPFLEDLLSLDVVLDTQPIQLLTVPTNGKTEEQLYLVFDKEIDPKSLPNTIMAIRRDL